MDKDTSLKNNEVIKESKDLNSLLCSYNRRRGLSEVECKDKLNIKKKHA